MVHFSGWTGATRKSPPSYSINKLTVYTKYEPEVSLATPEFPQPAKRRIKFNDSLDLEAGGYDSTEEATDITRTASLRSCATEDFSRASLDMSEKATIYTLFTISSFWAGALVTMVFRHNHIKHYTTVFATNLVYRGRIWIVVTLIGLMVLTVTWLLQLKLSRRKRLLMMVLTWWVVFTVTTMYPIADALNGTALRVLNDEQLAKALEWV